MVDPGPGPPLRIASAALARHHAAPVATDGGRLRIVAGFNSVANIQRRSGVHYAEAFVLVRHFVMRIACDGAPEGSGANRAARIDGCISILILCG